MTGLINPSPCNQLPHLQSPNTDDMQTDTGPCSAEGGGGIWEHQSNLSTHCTLCFWKGPPPVIAVIELTAPAGFECTFPRFLRSPRLDIRLDKAFVQPHPPRSSKCDQACVQTDTDVCTLVRLERHVPNGSPHVCFHIQSGRRWIATLASSDAELRRITIAWPQR